MRTPHEQEVALSQLAQFKRDPVGYLQGLMGQALAHCYEELLKCELDLQCHQAESSSTAKSVRNGYSRKTIASSVGPITLKVPRLRSGQFKSRLLPQYQRRPGARPQATSAQDTAWSKSLEAQVLHLCSYDIMQGLQADPYEFQQLFLSVFAPCYPDLTSDDLNYLMQAVGGSLCWQHWGALPQRYPVVVSARFDPSPKSGQLTPWLQASSPAWDILTTAHKDDPIYRQAFMREAYLTANALYLTCGISASGDCELIELYRPYTAGRTMVLSPEERAVYDELSTQYPPQSYEFFLHLSARLEFYPLALQHAIDERMISYLRQRGVKDVILFLGPHLQLSWDEVQTHFPFATLY